MENSQMNPYAGKKQIQPMEEKDENDRKQNNVVVNTNMGQKDFDKKFCQDKPSKNLLTLPSEKNPQRPELNVNKEFNYIFFEGDEIINQKKDIKYTIHALLGKGTSGQVFSCTSSSNIKMAIKVIKNQPAYTNQGLLEVKLLRQLAKLEKTINGSRENYLNVFDAFKWNGHVCMAMEIMDNSLLDILRQANYQGLEIKWIEMWTKKLLFSLIKVHREGIIHCDIKPQNIMFRPEKPKVPLLVDFSSGCFQSKQIFTYIQSRFYRAPEVLIKLTPYTEKIDIWSLGCVLAELYLGLPLFPGFSSYDQLKKIISFPLEKSVKKQMIMNSGLGTRYFKIQENTISFKDPDTYFHETGQFGYENENYYEFKQFSDMIGHMNPEEKSMQNHQLFVDLLKKMLVFDPSERISAEEAYLHPFTGGLASDLESLKNIKQVTINPS